MKRVIGIYLAAGQSCRMGSDKLQLQVGNIKLGSMALAAAVRSELEGVIVVTGGKGVPGWVHHDLVKEPMRAKWTYVECPEAHLGQAYSLRCGLEAAQRLGPDGVMILLGDQPCITVEVVNDLLRCYADHRASYVAACHAGLSRPPVIFGKETFPNLEKLEGDAGARHILRSEKLDGFTVTFDDPTLFYDVDTQEDYRMLLTFLRVMNPPRGEGRMHNRI